MKSAGSAALYCRLSRDDGGDAESNSIQTQRMMLQGYAYEHGFTQCNEYIDDGWSGINFERPQFKQMVEDIEAGLITTVICKDLSRLGRNNAIVAYYTEIFFCDYNVRFIAVNDGIDSAVGDNEIMPFKNVVNEYYARDVSKKVRSAFRARAINGEHNAGKAPYGYLKNPQDMRNLIVDHEAGPVVQQIFQMCADGHSIYAIRECLFEQRVLTPSALEFLRTGRMRAHVDYDKPYDWRYRTIEYILRNQVYLGHMVNHRQTTKSFKNPTIVWVPKDEWIIVEGTHEALISEEQFEKVQRIATVRERPNKRHGKNIFAGLLKCADCGRNSNYSSDREMHIHEGGFNCDGYRHSYRLKNGEHCTAHTIPYKPLRDSVLWQLNQVLTAVFDMEDFLARVQRGSSNTSEATQMAIAKLKQRDDQLRVFTRRVFEQKSDGTISDETFAEIYSGYQAEQKDLAVRVDELEAKLAYQRNEYGDIGRFLQLARKRREITDLTREVLLDFIEKIVVHEATGWRRNRHQEVEIHYRFIGRLDYLAQVSLGNQKVDLWSCASEGARR